MPNTPKAPPPWLISGIGRVRTALNFVSRSVIPPDLALFEMLQGAWLTQALHVAAKLGIADALASASLLKQRRDGRIALTMPFFDYLQTNPEYAGVFNNVMTGVSSMAIESLSPAYDLTDRRLIVDVGDADLLKTIIHDWDEDGALTILRNVRTAIAPAGKLLLLEMVLPEGTQAHPGMWLDLEMPVTAGGQERTATEYADLLSRAGFRQTRVVPTASPMSIIEGVPA